MDIVNKMNAGGSFKDVGVDWTLQLLSQLGAGDFYVMLLCNFTDSVYWVFNISQKANETKNQRFIQVRPFSFLQMDLV